MAYGSVLNRVADLRVQEGHGGESTSTGSSKMSDETDSKSKSPGQGEDGRSDLLAAIREGRGTLLLVSFFSFFL